MASGIRRQGDYSRILPVCLLPVARSVYYILDATFLIFFASFFKELLLFRQFLFIFIFSKDLILA
jgi:hypothetical protein